MELENQKYSRPKTFLQRVIFRFHVYFRCVYQSIYMTVPFYLPFSNQKMRLSDFWFSDTLRIDRKPKIDKYRKCIHMHLYIFVFRIFGFPIHLNYLYIYIHIYIYISCIAIPKFKE